MPPHPHPGAPETYLNAASHGSPDPAVVRRMIEHLDCELRLGATDARNKVEEEFSAVRSSAGRLLCARPEQIGFAATTFDAWLAIVSCLPLAGKRLLVAPHEWGDNVRTLTRLADRAGGRVEVLPPIDFAAPDLAPWQAMIDETVTAIFVPMVTSVAGHRYPVEQIGRLSRPDGTRLIVDAAQALGQVPIHVDALQCDALVATARKWLRGPRQTGLYWMKDLTVGAAKPIKAGNLEPFDANVALRLGLGVAIDNALSRSVERIENEISALSKQARARLQALGLTCLSHENAATGAVSFALPRKVAEPARQALAQNNCIVKWPTPAHEEPNGLEWIEGAGILRITPHIYNSTDDIDRVFDTLEAVLCGGEAASGRN